MSSTPLCALTIAGSDSGGGAGIQADLKTFAAHGVHGLSAIAALTAQNTRGVIAVHVPPVDFLRAQIDACFDDFRIGAVKLGMLATADVIHAVADALESHRPAFVVLDPVMVATSGARLLAEDALDAMRTRLLPLATLLTPNIPEAELLLGHPIDDRAIAADAPRRIARARPARGPAQGRPSRRRQDIVDRYDDRDTEMRFIHERIAVERPWYRLHPGVGDRREPVPWIAVAGCLRRSDRLRVRGACAGVPARRQRHRRPRPFRRRRPSRKSKQGQREWLVDRLSPLSWMARPERFELPTPKFVAWCSIQLSYGRRSGIVQNRGRFRQFILTCIGNWRRLRDSNPRWSF